MTHHPDLDCSSALPILPSIWSLQIQASRDSVHSNESANCDGFKHRTRPDPQQDVLAYFSALALLAQGPPPSPSAWPSCPPAAYPDPTSTPLQWALTNRLSPADSLLAQTRFPYAAFPATHCEGLPTPSPPPLRGPPAAPPPAYLGRPVAAPAPLAAADALQAAIASAAERFGPLRR
eukprot:CAMPEP_0172203570 /NCGR_PEP_ID=MMETSP1050-20130122/31367_1 /TAXON_ID=233186 /ORGANISM="Cryptomonas curvata, Strain CCAP979/52" /LENGTH=176 /DNA_ID=CAMNT_0012881819 /DNA_START=384 /DNA_END=911 /DNA_ORIENTATION=+